MVFCHSGSDKVSSLRFLDNFECHFVLYMTIGECRTELLIVHKLICKIRSDPVTNGTCIRFHPFTYQGQTVFKF